MRRVLRIMLIGGVVVTAAFVASMVYAGWKSRPQIPPHPKAS